MPTPIDELEFALFDALIGGSDIPGLLSVAQPYFDNPVSVSNVHLEVLGYMDDPSVQDRYWNRINSTNMATHYDLEEDTAKASFIPSEHASVFIPPIEGHPIMACAAIWEKKTYAYLLMLGYHRDFNGEDAGKLETLGRVVAFAIGYRIQSWNEGKSETEHVFLELLAGKRIAPESIERYLGRDHVSEPAARIYIMVAEPELRYDAASSLPPYEVRALGYEMPHEVVVEYKNQAVVLLRNVDDAPGMISQLERVMGHRSLRCGISVPFDDWNAVCEHYGEAVRALALGVRLFPESARCIPYQSVSFYDFLESIASDDVTRYCDPEVEALIEFDQQNRTMYFQTFAVYLLLCGDMRRASAELCIHRSTLQYRMGKVKEHLFSDIQDAHFANRAMNTVLIRYFLDPAGFCGEFGIPRHLLDSVSSRV